MRAEMVREGRESRIAKRSRAVESSERTWLALLALALGGFAIGATEFVAMGLLPSLANDLLPGLYAQSQERANAQAG
jgi:MFS transporter, DHA1 family, inner membrane transport protein